MLRRNIPKAILATAVGSALAGQDARAQSNHRPPHYARSDAERLANVTPLDYAYPPGDIRRYGALDSSDCTSAIQAALDGTRQAYIPDNFTALCNGVNVAAAGCTIRGASRYTSILAPIAGIPPWAPLIHNAVKNAGTSYGLVIDSLRFRLHNSSEDVSCIGIDLSSINNAVITSCRFEGFSKLRASAVGAVGVRFGAPLSQGGYTNEIRGCDFTELSTGVQYGQGANNNHVFGGEFILCDIGIDAAPGWPGVDTPNVFGSRFENCNTGLKEGAVDGLYIGLRFENQAHCDIDFISGSQRPVIIGGHTTWTAVPINNISNAASPMLLSPSLSASISSSRALPNASPGRPRPRRYGHSGASLENGRRKEPHTVRK